MSINKQLKWLLPMIVLFLALWLFQEELRALWQGIVFDIQRWQNNYRREMTMLMRQMRGGAQWQTWWLLVSLGFVYGILHAAGPGHGKAVITTFLLTQPSGYKNALWLAVGGAVLQGISAVLWVAVTVGALQWLIRDAMSQIIWAERLSYALIIAAGIYMLAKAVRQYRGGRHHHAEHHHAHEHCGCGHHHAPQAQTAFWASLLAIGARPCSGSILALAVAAAWQLWAVGIAMTFAISAGTAITVLSLALLTIYGREQAAKRLTLSAAAAQKGLLMLAAIGAFLLIGLGLILLFSARPLPVLGL